MRGVHAGRLALALVGVLATLGAALRPATADEAGDLVDAYRATTGRRDDAAYATQERTLTALADLRTPVAQRAVRRLLDEARAASPGGTSDRRRLVLLLAAFVRHGAPEDLDAVLRIVEGERDPALVAALPRIVAGIQAPAAREHLRGAAFRRAVPALKARLARALGASGDREATLALVAALADPDFDVRAEALFALGELRDEGAYPHMTVFLSGEDPRLREVAARALGVLGAPRAVPALARALDDPAPRVVESAATSLGVLGAPAGVAPLIERLAKARGADLRLEEALERALVRLTGKTDLGADAELWRAWWAEHHDDAAPRPEPEAPTTVAGPRYYGFPVRTSRAVFVLDVSRSMGWNGRLETAQTELKQVLAHLPAATKFNLVTYSDTAAAWSETLVPATVENVRRAARFVDRLRPVNATNIWDGLRVAMADEAVDTVFFLSDGSPTAGAIVDPEAILAELEAMNRWRRVRFHTIALTRGAPPAMFAGSEDPVAAASFMARLAKATDGTFREVK